MAQFIANVNASEVLQTELINTFTSFIWNNNQMRAALEV
jgi:hypothetical protein